MTDDVSTDAPAARGIELEDLVRHRDDAELDDVPGATAAFRELAGLVLADGTLGQTMSRIADLVAAVVPGADEASITLIDDQRPATVAFSTHTKLAHALDERQYEDGAGPCIDAAVTGRAVHIRDTAGQTLYPAFAQAAQRAGAGATLAVGLPSIHRVTGAVNIYSYVSSQSGSGFSEQSLTVAAGFAGYAGVALTNASLYAGAIEEVAQMQEAMASRAVIEQAKGMLMGEYHCDSERAFDMLRELSMGSNQKLRDVARSITEAAASASRS